MYLVRAICQFKNHSWCKAPRTASRKDENIIYLYQQEKQRSVFRQSDSDSFDVWRCATNTASSSPPNQFASHKSRLFLFFLRASCFLISRCIHAPPNTANTNPHWCNFCEAFFFREINFFLFAPPHASPRGPKMPKSKVNFSPLTGHRKKGLLLLLRKSAEIYARLSRSEASQLAVRLLTEDPFLPSPRSQSLDVTVRVATGFL